MMKKKKLTKSDLNMKLLDKYKVNLEELNYDALKAFKEKIKDLLGKRENVNIKYGILW